MANEQYLGKDSRRSRVPDGDFSGFSRPAPPDPHGLLGLGIVGGVIALYLLVPLGPGGRLLSSVLWIEALAHVWLIAGPPAAAYIGIRHLSLGGQSPVPLVTVPAAAFLTLVTWVGVTLGVLSG